MVDIPSEIVLLIAQHIFLAKDSRTLSSLSKASQTSHRLLTPLLYRNLTLTQKQLLKLLSHPSLHYTHVRSLTLMALGQSFDISTTPALLHQPDKSMPIFPNATTLKFSDYVDFAPPGFQYLPRLLLCERLIIDTRVYSWRISTIPPLWPQSLRVVELQCRNWTCPFIAPGIHHVIHLSQLASPFRHPPPSSSSRSRRRSQLTSDPTSCPSILTKDQNVQRDAEADNDDDDDDDVDPDDPAHEPYRHLLETTFRWLTHCIDNCAKAEQAQGTGLTAWELRIQAGGPKEIRWAEKRVAEMLINERIGEGRVELDETGELRLRCLKFVLDQS